MNAAILRSIAVAPVAIAALLVNAHASAADIALPRDGWVSWQVTAVAQSPAWCCFGSGVASSSDATCRLDESGGGYSNHDGETTESLRIYARLHDGKVERLRALASDCPVRANSNIQQLNTVTDDDSAKWLASLLKEDSDGLAFAGKRLRGDVLAALSAHRSTVAGDAITSIARDHSRIDVRKDAVFWLTQARGIEGAHIATAIMFDDENPRMREHAAFAVAQSKSPQIATDLIRLGTTDRDRKVRSQAWFWLGQKASPQAEQAIGAALRTERDQQVREQAIFALSQLPDDRSTKALIKVAENTTLSREDRKKAVFWLAQEGSDSALAYLDRIMTTKH